MSNENTTKKPFYKKWWFYVTVIIVIISIVRDGKKSSSSSLQSDSSGKSPKAAAPNMQLPLEEQKFVDIVQKAQKDASKASNDMAKGGILAIRSKNLKELETSVQNWFGRVVKIGSNSDGKGVLSIEVASDVTICTWNNALSDIGDKTLIEPGSDLFNTAAALRKGQKVKFSGSFISDDETGFSEQSLSLDGKIKDPEFTFKFSSIEGL